MGHLDEFFVTFGELKKLITLCGSNQKKNMWATPFKAFFSLKHPPSKQIIVILYAVEIIVSLYA